MSTTRVQTLSVRVPATLVQALQETADQRGILVSELVRSALLTHLALDPHTRHLATVLDELVQIRALLVRLLDTPLPAADVEPVLAVKKEFLLDPRPRRL